MTGYQPASSPFDFRFAAVSPLSCNALRILGIIFHASGLFLRLANDLRQHHLAFIKRFSSSAISAKASHASACHRSMDIAFLQWLSAFWVSSNRLYTWAIPQKLRLLRHMEMDCK